MSTADRVRELVLPILAGAELDLYDLDFAGGVLQVLVDREGGAGIDAIAKASRAISRALDEHDELIAGHYTLEVGSPGLERPLRTPEHFARAVGSTVKVKTRPGTEGDRRIAGTIKSADADTVTVESAEGTAHTVRFDDIERARTTFEWGSVNEGRKKP
jgi:ribosome maturation factor RimP